MPISLAVLIDKINVLSDQPTAVTEHRMRITHEELNNMILDVTPEKNPLTMEVKTVKVNDHHEKQVNDNNSNNVQ